MHKSRYILLSVLLSAYAILVPCQSKAQDSTISSNNHRLLATEITAGGLYAISMVTLGEFWYKDQFRPNFMWQDDIHEWFQMDKCGHLFSAYYEGYYGMHMLESAGMEHNKALWYGGLWGVIMQDPIEIFDGFSKDYGASRSDLAANTLGTALVIGQQLLWDDQKIVLKFSYHPTNFAQYRPNLLGSNQAERFVKDYNGQTYWLGTGLYQFAPKLNIPKWLNISIGYGAEGMTGAYNNPLSVNGKPIPAFTRYRQYYLSLDLNLFKIKTKSKFVNTVLSAIGFIKFPTPTLEFNQNGKWIFRGIYF